ncbi:MAG: hypothetical protein ISR58_03725 [Anaerolineales bacterium]|nr:hypothetical protein [Chloroflexota bacterium]MBL6980281.1 hypothetical protein [Anaerolineales bacterium]
MKIFQQVLWISLVIVLAGCGGAVATSSSTETPVVEVPTPEPTVTEIPTATSLPPVGVLLASPDADPQIVEILQNELSQSITDAGMRFQVRPSLSPESITAEDIQWVIALPPAPDLATLIASSPDTRFLAIGVGDLEPAPNLSMIGSSSDRFDQQGFLAGYLAAMLTPDWRVGVISIADNEAGQLARKSFITGAKYYCGFCSPAYPPFYEYPLYVQLNGGATGDEWLAAADFLLQRGITTIYVVPGAGDGILLNFLAQSGIQIIGGDTPPDDIRDAWIATLGFSSLDAFYTFWPEFSAGADGQNVSVPISISNINANILSPGKQRLLEEVLVMVQGNEIELIGRNIP